MSPPASANGIWGGEDHDPTRQGFDLNFGGTHRGSPPSYFCPYEISTIESCPEGEYLTDRLTAEAERFIEENRNRPFFLYLSHFTVHTPLEAKADVISKYQAKVRPDEPQRHAVYAAMVESMDDSVGRVLRKLEEVGIGERTVVFFTSDNGGLIYEGRREEAVTSNAPLRAGKGHLYEGGIRVPFIVRWPGVVAAGSVSTEVVTSPDVLPTALEMAGVRTDASDSVEGVSLMPILRDGQSLERPAVYWHYPHYSNQGGEPGGAIRQGEYKLIEFYRDQKLELYDLSVDVSEVNDLADEMPDRVAEMRGALQDWRASVKATMPAVNPNYDATKSDQGLTGAQR